MTIKKKKSSSLQQSLFDYLREVEKLTRQSEDPSPGSLDIEKEYKAAMTEDLRHAEDPSGRRLSRFEVADTMSRLLGREVTKDMLDNWTAFSHPHLMPGAFQPAFAVATGGRRTYEVVGHKAGLFVLPGEEALRAEIQKLDEQLKHIKNEKLKRTLFLKEINGGRP